MFQHFGLKLPILGQNLSFWVKWGQMLKFNILTHKRHILARFHIFWATKHQNPSRRL